MIVNSFLLLYYIYLGIGLEAPVFLIKNTGIAKGEEVAIRTPWCAFTKKHWLPSGGGGESISGARVNKQKKLHKRRFKTKEA